MLVEELEPALAAQHHRRGRQAVGGHRRFRDDRDAGQVGDWLARARIENVAFSARARGATFVVARRAHRDVGQVQRARKQALSARMLDADVPILTAGVVAAYEQVATGLDAEVGIRPQLLNGQIDRQAFGHRIQVEHQRPAQRDRAGAAIEPHVMKIATVCADMRVDDFAGAVVGREAKLLHGGADGRIERPVRLFGQVERKRSHFEQQRAHAHRASDLADELHHFAGWIEPRANPFDRLEPGQGALDCRLDGLARLVGDHVDVHPGVHRHTGEIVLGAHPRRGHHEPTRLSKAPGRRPAGRPASCTWRG